MGMERFAIGTIAFFPFKCAKRGSSGWMQMAVSPKSVSGRVVATVKNSSAPSMAYLM